MSAIDALLEKHVKTEESLIAVLKDIQNEYGYLP
jgi:NADH:ubiquinone oxidoreductase subunit E